MADLPDLDAVGDQLGRKVGPLPAWAWAAIAVVGVTAAIMIRRRLGWGGVGAPAEPDGESGDDATLDEMVGTASPYVPGGFVIGGGPTQATGSTGGADVPAAPTVPKTNTDWARDAQRYLLGRGYQGTVVADAISRHLGGQTLTSQGQAIIDAAYAGIGAPPIPVPPPTVSPSPEPMPSPGGGGSKPKPKPTPKPPAKVTTPAKRAPTVEVGKPPVPPTPKDREHRVASSGSSEYPYNLYRRYYGKAPTVAELQRWAAYNGRTVGPSPGYVVSGHAVGTVYKFPTKQP